MEVANNYTSQRKVENGGKLDAKVLEGPYKTFTRFMNNLDDSINNSSTVLFGVKPLSYIDKTPNHKRKNLSGPTSDSKKSNNTVARGWLVCSGGNFTFPDALSKTPCRNFALEGLECSFGRTCKYDHKVYPKGYRRSDLAIICDWVNKTSNVSFANCISEKDRNHKFSPFTPSGSKSQPPSTTTPTPGGAQTPGGTNTEPGAATTTPPAAN